METLYFNVYSVEMHFALAPVYGVLLNVLVMILSLFIYRMFGVILIMP